jgi:hypothetical protein
MPQVIPRSIAGAETLIRGIVHPYFYSESKGKLKPEAFLPPPAKRDVSVLRLNYADAPFCKQHCKDLRMGRGGLYVGMAALLAEAVDEAAQLPAVAGAVVVEATPLNEHKQLVAATAEVTTADAGLPMHADILYSQPVEKGVPNQGAHMAARYLMSKARYYRDPAPTEDGWRGEALDPPPRAAA